MDEVSAPQPLLRHAPFVRFLYVRIAATVALQTHALAIGWQMYVLTSSSFNLGLVGLVQFLPTLTLFLLTGQAADRYDRRTVAATAQGVEALSAGVLAVCGMTASLTPGVLLAMAFVAGAGRSFEQPSLQSSLPNIVPPSVLPRAIAAANSAAQCAVVAGPALGGALIAISPTLAFAVSTLLWLSAAVAMVGITMKRPSTKRPPVDLSSLFSGFSFIRRQKVVLGAITLDLFAVLLGSATALLPIFASDIFKAGPLAFGGLRAAPAAGAIVAALALTRRPLSRRVGHAMFVSVAVYGLGTIALALAPNLVLAMAALLTVGAADTVSVVIRQTLVQFHTPDHMRGRVYAVNSMFTSTSNQLGTFRAGTEAAMLGAVPAVLLGGLSTLVIVGVSLVTFRDLYWADGYEPARERGLPH